MIKIKNTIITQDDIEKFYNRINIITEGEHINCWEIDFYKNASGYPIFHVKQVPVSANRFMYLIHHQDENIENKLVCHTCDHPWCVNPDHLFTGTHQDNANDKVNKGRQARGETFNVSKLKDVDIINMLEEIKAGKYKTVTEISDYYPIKNSEVNQIIKGGCWKHITKNYDLVKIRNMISKDNYKLTKEDIIDIKDRLNNGESYCSISKRYNITRQFVSGIKLGKYHK